MTKRIFRSICFVALAVFAASIAIIMGVLYDYFSKVQIEQLRTEAELCARVIESEGADYFDSLADDGLRVTWISSDGSVLYDSVSDEDTMEKHLEREEIIEALDSGYGESTRYSDTLTVRAIYCARLLEDGTVIRLSVTHDTVIMLMLGMLPPILIVFTLSSLLALVLADRLSKYIVKPLNELDLDDPLSNEEYDELSHLLRRIDSQQSKLKWQEQQIRRKRDELDVVTDSMNEGLVLLNERWVILSINRSAASLLGTDRYCVGRDIMSVNRTIELKELLERVSLGERAEKVVSLTSGEYQLDASPVISDGGVAGIALLMFDVTEKERSEQMRKEFTANVSHELKTPLHSISGYAELISNGMVRTEDVGNFAGKIYFEAQRMIRLVEDIIRLSRLDEGAEDMKREKIDLFSLASESVMSLNDEAHNAGVTLTLEGESARLECIPRLVSGVIFNLCDNAIKYNRHGGSVCVKVESSEESVILTVRDTGIGIMPEDQMRIFERFYRVDKSRSKEVGGTGLGLSIVKHAAKIHNARIDLESAVGEGTTVTVAFPKK